MKVSAIAAMSLNRVIGQGNSIPWHLPEDWKWFKEKTTGKTLLMGRKTFDSIGRPLPNRRTLVLTRSRDEIPGVELIHDLSEVEARAHGDELMVCGGAEVYRQTMHLWDDLYLTLVKREMEGDTFFPPFEDQFVRAETIMERPEFTVFRYERKT